jgi:hypothetical protein
MGKEVDTQGSCRSCGRDKNGTGKIKDGSKMRSHRAQSILDFVGNFYHSSHLHTIILFTWTDYKTIFFPIVSRVPLILSVDRVNFMHNIIDLICFSNSPGSLPVTLAASLLVDMATFNSLQCL